MKKTLLLVLASALVFILAGCSKQQAKEQGASQSGQKTEQGQEQGGVISSIKDAIGMGKKMKCTYTLKTGNETDTFVTYVEGKKYKSESEFGGKIQYSVSDGEVVYSWNNKDKNGTKMDIKCLEDLKKPDENNTSNTTDLTKSITDPEEQFDDAMDTKCESVSSIDFSIPSDVAFKDQCEELKRMMESLDKLKSQMPNIPSGNIPGASL
jgi:hypothetical protein